MPTVNVGSILSTTVGTYVNEPPSVLTGTVGVGDVVGSTIYLGAAASSSANSYIGYWLTTGRSAPPQYLWKVTSYDQSTKRATISWDIPLTVGDNWKLVIDYPLQRDFQWYRDGVAISNAVHTMYTAQAADIGKNLTVKETVWKISSSNDGRTYEGPVNTTTTISAPVTVTGSAPSSKLVYQDNLSYLGSFALPTNIAGTETKFGVTCIGLIPAAYSVSGASSLAVSYRQVSGHGDDGVAVEYIGMAELEIPATLSSSSSFAALPVAVVRKTSSDAYGGQGTVVAGSSGSYSTASGLQSGSDFRSNGPFNIYGSANCLVTQVGTYTQQPNGFFWRRNVDLTVTSVEGPFTVVDPVRNQLLPRPNAGFMTKVPAAWQTALGGDIIAGNGNISTVGSASDGPSAICFNSANIAATIAKVETGTAQGGSTNTIRLAASANSTNDYYKNFWVYAPSASPGSLRITSYNGFTKEATVDIGIVQWTTIPTSSTTYKLIPYLAGNQLSRYDVGQLDPLSAYTDSFTPIWNGGTFSCGMFWPNGTDSLVFIGNGGGCFYAYGNKSQMGNGSLKRIYDFCYPLFDGPGPMTGFSPNGNGIKFWSYSAADLAAVVSGALTFNTIKPRASWSIRLPSYNSYTGLAEDSPLCVYDQSTSRLYITSNVWSDSPYPLPLVGKAVHVFQITNATNL
jgi:hypothetical protein